MADLTVISSFRERTSVVISPPAVSEGYLRRSLASSVSFLEKCLKTVFLISGLKSFKISVISSGGSPLNNLALFLEGKASITSVKMSLGSSGRRSSMVS